MRKSLETTCNRWWSIDLFHRQRWISDLAKIVKLSFKNWEKALDNVIKFKYVQDESDADIEIEFKKGKGKTVGKTVTYFDYNGFIEQADISISKNHMVLP